MMFGRLGDCCLCIFFSDSLNCVVNEDFVG